jgi:acyl dehydratase
MYTQGGEVASDAERPARQITDETIEALQRRIGIPVRRRDRPHVVVTSEDSIRHFANAIGQDDPIHCDPDYGKASPWASVIAPPLYYSATGTPVQVDWTPEQADAMSGGDPLAGIGQYMIREQWVFHRPVRPGDQILRREALHSIEERPRSEDGRRTLWVTHLVTNLGADGTVFAEMQRMFHHADRDRSGAGGHHDSVPLEPATYDADAYAEIDAGYAAEAARGAEPRHAKDVAVGDSIGRIVRGPLTVGDVISYHVGIGWGGFGVGSTRLAWRKRQRMPKLFVPNSQGVLDTVQRCHWEDEWAQSLGQPLAYDYGAMRSNWATSLIRDWMGDTGWLWRFESRIRRFNHRGDTTWFSGAVVGVEPDQGRVDVEIEGVNQRGTQTCTATASILLPLAGEQLPRIPEPVQA